MLDDDLAVAVAAERDLARQHLEQQHAQRIDIRAVIDLDLPLALLGGHVVRGSHDRPGARLVADLLIGQRQFREAEVEHLDEVAARAAVVAQEDVLGLEVAVDDPLLVRRVERVRDLAGDGKRGRGVQPVFAPQPIGQRLALQVLHHEVEFAVRRVAEVGDIDDVLVTDLVDRFCFGHEARHHVGVLGELRVDGLHRHLLANHGVLRQVDDPHPPFPQLGGDLVIPDRVADIDHWRGRRGTPL